MTEKTAQQQPSCRTDGPTTAFSEKLGIPMRINGMGPYMVSVDTGAGLTVVLPEVASELKLAKVGEEKRHGAGGPVTFDLVGVETVEAGGVEVNLDAIGVGLFLKRLCGRNFKGNLGYDVLRHGKLTANFAGQTMVFGPADNTAIDGVPFNIESVKQPLVVVDVEVNGKGPYPFAVDTGAMGTCIAPRLADELAVLRGQPVQAAGVGGTLEAYFAASPIEFAIGGRYRSEAIPVVLDIFGARSDGKCADLCGLIGQDIMRNFIVTFDYPHRVLGLAEPPSP
jgi:predicted aspartyl protease